MVTVPMLAAGLIAGVLVSVFQTVTSIQDNVLMPTVTIPSVGSATGLAVVITREMAIGLALGMSIRALVAAAELAGQLAGFQMGLSYAATVDPQSGVRNNLLSMLYGNIAV